MKLGVMIEAQEGVGWEEWRNITRWTEELGYESLWRSDHWFSFGPERASLDALEAMISLVHVAENTSRIRFGTLVLSMTFRQPAIVARMAAQIDQLSGGRLILGIGAGWNQDEHDAFDIDLPPPRPRIKALDEGAAVIRALWSGEPATFQGKHFQLKDATIRPLPAQSPMPRLIGGSGEKRTLAVVARHADEWNMGARPLETYRAKVAALEAYCEREKRDPATISRSLMASYVTGTDEAEVKRCHQALIESLPPQFRRMFDDAPKTGVLRNLPMLVGTPPQLVEQIQALEAEGVSRIMLQNRTPPDHETLELVAKEVLPHVG